MRKTACTSLLLVAMIVALAPSVHALDTPHLSSQPRLRISNVRLVEGDDGMAKAVFDVIASRGAHASVRFKTVDETAAAGTDYTASSGTLTFTPQRTTRRVAVDVIGDGIAEENETFTIKLSSPDAATIADRTGRATITNDDAGGSAISIANATVTEGNAGTVNAVFSVTLSLQTSEPVTLEYATADGSATTPADFVAVSGTLTFDPGQTVKQLVVPVTADSVPEINETYAVNLSDAAGASFADGVAVGTITDDDTPTISVANAAVTEGNSTVNAVFTVTLSVQSSQSITADFATVGGSATSPADYQATTGTVTFTPGQTVEQIVVPVVGDTLIETTEAFSLNLSNPVNATFADPSAQATITDNDTVTISIGAVTVTEVNVGTRDAVFTVTLSAVNGNTVTVDFTTGDGSATSPADYLATSGTLTFLPGQVSKQIVVQTVGDFLIETNETYSVNLSNPVNATIAGSGYGLGTITNND